MDETNDKKRIITNEEFLQYTEKLENYCWGINYGFIDGGPEVYKEIDDIIEILSNSDLSQVEPESFFDCYNLEDLNLEGSGAKLDMQYFKRARINGSIKGCELISFDLNKYINDENKNNINLDFF